MKRISLLLPALIICICLLSAWQILSIERVALKAGQIKKPISTFGKDDSTHYEKDILSSILELNSDEKFKPRKDFKKGIVTAARLSNYLQKTENGFCIKLPSTTNIPTPAVINGNIYISGGFGSRQYYSFDANTGQLKWAINLDDDGPSSPAIEDNIVVFNTESCTIFACDLITGSQIWSYFLGDPLMSMPTIANGIVFTSYPASYHENR